MSLRVIPTPLKLPAVAVRARADAGIGAWYGWRGSDSHWAARAAAVRAEAGADWLSALQPAIDASGVAAERLGRAARNGIVVTTGQQSGLFGGPLYTWFKALSALALADELERRLQLPVAPVFWAATDDSDLAEATTTTVNLDDGARTITLERAVERDTPMSAVPVGNVSAELGVLATACGSAANSGILELVRRAYRPESTLGGAFVELLRGVLEPLGIAVLDAAHPATRMAAGHVTRGALERADSIASRLQQRSQEMTALGIKPQVRHTPGRTLVFSMNGARRHRIRMNEAADLAARAQAQELAPNVLLRPLVERSILPTVAYVGGPAEIAYFAQVSAVAEVLELEPPHIVPRWSGFLVEPNVAHTLEELGAGVDELANPHALEQRLAREELPESLRAALLEAQENAARLEPTVIEAAKQADLPLPAAVARGAARQLEHKVDRLERRLLAVVKRHGSQRLRRLAAARGSLYPRDLPQERALNMVPLLARYGDEPLVKVLDAARAYAGSL